MWTAAKDTAFSTNLADAAKHVTVASTRVHVRVFAWLMATAPEAATGSEDWAVIVKMVVDTLSVYTEPKSVRAVEDAIATFASNTTFAKLMAEQLVVLVAKNKGVAMGLYVTTKLMYWLTTLMTHVPTPFLANAKVCHRLVETAGGLVDSLVLGDAPQPRLHAALGRFGKVLAHAPVVYDSAVKVLADAAPTMRLLGVLGALMAFRSDAIPSLAANPSRPLFLTWYTQLVLASRTPVSPTVHAVFTPLVQSFTHADFAALLPVIERGLKRMPELVMEAMAKLLANVQIDVGQYVPTLFPAVLQQLVVQQARHREGACRVVRCLADKCTDVHTIEHMLGGLEDKLSGKTGKLSRWDDRLSMVRAIGELCKTRLGRAVVPLATRAAENLVQCVRKEVHEEVNRETHRVLSEWLLRVDTLPTSVVSWYTVAIGSTKQFVRRSALESVLHACTKQELVAQLAPLVGTLTKTFTEAMKFPGKQRFELLAAARMLVLLAAVDGAAQEAVAKCALWKSMFAPTSPINAPDAIAASSADEVRLQCGLICAIVRDNVFELERSEHGASLYKSFVLLLTHHQPRARRYAKQATKSLHAVYSPLAEGLLAALREHLVALGGVEDATTPKANVISPTSRANALTRSQERALLQGALLSVPGDTPPAALAAKFLLTAHHPQLVNPAAPSAMWAHIAKLYRKANIDISTVLNASGEELCNQVLGADGLRSTAERDVQAALYSLHALASQVPDAAFTIVLPWVLRELSCKSDLDGVSANDLYIFHTPEGMLSRERRKQEEEWQGGVAESKNVRRDKSQRGTYSVEDEEWERELRKKLEAKKAAQNKRKGGGKGGKGAGAPKDKRSKQEIEAFKADMARERTVRTRVAHLHRQLIISLKALAAMAKANPQVCAAHVHTIVGTMPVLLQHRLTNEEAARTVRALVSIVRERRVQHLTANIAKGFAAVYAPTDDAAAAADSGAMLQLCTDVAEQLAHIVEASGVISSPSFVMCVPLIDRVMCNSDNLETLEACVDLVGAQAAADASSPLLRPRLVLALAHVLGMSPRMVACVRPALYAVSEGAHPADNKAMLVALLDSLLAEQEHVRKVVLQAWSHVPAVAAGLPADTDVGARLWYACHDVDYQNQELAQSVWEAYGHELADDFAEPLIALLGEEVETVRSTAADALSTAMAMHPPTVTPTLEMLFELYASKVGTAAPPADDHASSSSGMPSRIDEWQPPGRATFEPDPSAALFWMTRHGVALALQCAAREAIQAEHLSRVFTFFIDQGLGDEHEQIRQTMVEAGMLIINQLGKQNMNALLPVLEDYLNKPAPPSVVHDRIRESVVVFLGGLAKHLERSNPKVADIVDKLIETLKTPSERVGVAVAKCLPPLIPAVKGDAERLVNLLMERTLSGSTYGDRRGAAHGLAGIVKGLGLSSLKAFKITDRLKEAVANKKDNSARQGALFAFECLSDMLGRLFEPYIIRVLPLLLVCFSDNAYDVREAAEGAARAIMGQLSGQGVKMVLPGVFQGLEDTAWRTKVGSIELLGAMAFCQPRQLSHCLPSIVPVLLEVLTDTHTRVHDAARTALENIASVIRNPEIAALVPTILDALLDPNEKTSQALDTLMSTTFVNYVDSPSLSLIVPIVHRGLKERSTEVKKRAAAITGNMCSLIADPLDIRPYLPKLLPSVKVVLVDPIPEVRAVAARALGTLVHGVGEEHFVELVPWLLDTLCTDMSSVERSGAAQGLAEVVNGVGVHKLDELLPRIGELVMHPKAYVREGAGYLFTYLPIVLGTMFEPYISKVLPHILRGLADEAESVRDVSLRAGKQLVTQFAMQALDMLVPALEEGMGHANWRIRENTVYLLGDLLQKVAGTSTKTNIAEEWDTEHGYSTEQQDAQIVSALGRDRRDAILAALYLLRCDESSQVKQAAAQVWKGIVVNTPRTVRQILPRMMSTLVAALASDNPERRLVAGRSIGELVRKMGESVVQQVIPILEEGLRTGDANKRQGVCLGLDELMQAGGRVSVQQRLSSIIPAVRTALCDDDSEVRATAASAFNTLHRYVGDEAIDKIIPSLLESLSRDNADPAVSRSALHGLREILALGGSSVLDFLIPQLTSLPFTYTHARALAALSGASGEAVMRFADKIVPAFLTVLAPAGGEDTVFADTAKEWMGQARTGALHFLVPVLLDTLSNERSTEERLGGAKLMGLFCECRTGDLEHWTTDILVALLTLFNDDSVPVQEAALAALGALTKKLTQELMPAHIRPIRETISHVRLAAMQVSNEEWVMPGFCLKKGIGPLVPIMVQGLLGGSAEIRENAAAGLGDIIDVTSPDALSPYVPVVTGPLIRVVGDKYPWQVKSAILATLTQLVEKGGRKLKAFIPQLQTTFVKSLRDSVNIVRSRAANALGKLITLNPRVGPLVTELHSGVKGSAAGVKEAMLKALCGVLAHAGAKVKAPLLADVRATLLSLLADDDECVRDSAAAALGALASALGDEDVAALVEGELCGDAAGSSSWEGRQGRALALAAFVQHAPTAADTLVDTVMEQVSTLVIDDKVPVRQAGIATWVGYVLKGAKPLAPSVAVALPDVVECTNDTAVDVKKDALDALRELVGAEAGLAHSNLAMLVPAVSMSMKDRVAPVRLAAEHTMFALLSNDKARDAYMDSLSSDDVTAVADAWRRVSRKVADDEWDQ